MVVRCTLSRLQTQLCAPEEGKVAIQGPFVQMRLVCGGHPAVCARNNHVQICRSTHNGRQATCAKRARGGQGWGINRQVGMLAGSQRHSPLYVARLKNRTCCRARLTEVDRLTRLASSVSLFCSLSLKHANFAHPSYCPPDAAELPSHA